MGVFSHSSTVTTLGLLTRMSCLNSRSALASVAGVATTSGKTHLVGDLLAGLAVARAPHLTRVSRLRISRWAGSEPQAAWPLVEVVVVHWQSHKSPAGRSLRPRGTAFCNVGQNFIRYLEVRSLRPHGIPVAGAKFGDLRAEPLPRSTFVPSRCENHSANCRLAPRMMHYLARYLVALLAADFPAR
jgi:hypothetical protein